MGQDSVSLSREDQFKDHYVAAFMAAYKAASYEELCSLGKHDQLNDHGAIEDAEFLADLAWKAFVELSPRMRKEGK